jgi:hypothetical protein
MWIIQEPDTLELWNKLHFEQKKIESIYRVYTFGAWIIFFLILAHPVYKMWIKQEPDMLELWNKLHFEEETTGSIYCV